ncbi:carbohydrate kinase family protein [Paeniglutamicibacter sp. MACA_103]|uniref:carbohydrate kinase family protein n=1 Tax=Paeniglutamicibacter sp. MACA_103 TaxID=3377337 RepID=UPI003895B0BB
MILFCGYANRDVVVQVREMPRAGERLHSEGITTMDGGMAANAAVAAARFGAETTFVGSLGVDAASRDFQARLHAENICTNWTSLDGFLSHAAILVDQHGERSVISQDDSLQVSHLQEVLSGLDRDSEHWIYLDGYRWNHDWMVNPGNLRIVVDIDGAQEKAQILRAADAATHLLGSHRTFLGTCGFSETELRSLAEDQGITIVITRGADGLSLFVPGVPTLELAAFPTHVVDDTGAGDCFAGVYVASLAAGSSSEAAARTASAAAALACRGNGARRSPRRPELDRFMTTLSA